MPTLDQVAAGAHEVAETAAAVAKISENVETTVTATGEIVKRGSRTLRYVMWTVVIVIGLGIAALIVSKVRSRSEPEPG